MIGNSANMGNYSHPEDDSEFDKKVVGIMASLFGRAEPNFEIELEAYGVYDPETGRIDYGKLGEYMRGPIGAREDAPINTMSPTEMKRVMEKRLLGDRGEEK